MKGIVYDRGNSICYVPSSMTSKIKRNVTVFVINDVKEINMRLRGIDNHQKASATLDCINNSSSTSSCSNNFKNMVFDFGTTHFKGL